MCMDELSRDLDFSGRPGLGTGAQMNRSMATIATFMLLQFTYPSTKDQATRPLRSPRPSMRWVRRSILSPEQGRKGDKQKSAGYAAITLTR